MILSVASHVGPACGCPPWVMVMDFIPSAHLRDTVALLDPDDVFSAALMTIPPCLSAMVNQSAEETKVRSYPLSATEMSCTICASYVIVLSEASHDGASLAAAAWVTVTSMPAMEMVVMRC